MRRTLILLPLLFVLFAPAPGHAASYCDGYAYATLGTRLLRFDPATGDTTLVRELPASLNALAAHRGELYAIARTGSTPVKLTADGAIVELGPIAGAPPLSGAYIAAAHGDSWFLLHEGVIFRVNLDRLDVTGRVPLRGEIRAGDWAANRGGRLLTLSTLGPRAALVAIDPASGAMEAIAEPAGLPGGSVFGAIWLHGNELYAWHNAESAIYAIDLAAPGTARLVRSGLPSDELGGLDAAACEPEPAPTPTATPSPDVASPPILGAPVTIDTPFAAATPVQPPPAGPPALLAPPAPPAPPAAAPQLPPARRAPAGPPRRNIAPANPHPNPPIRRGSTRAGAQRDERPLHRHLAVGAGVLTLALLLSLRGNGARGGR